MGRRAARAIAAFPPARGSLHTYLQRAHRRREADSMGGNQGRWGQSGLFLGA